jgi:hypothetical protein
LKELYTEAWGTFPKSRAAINVSTAGHPVSNIRLAAPQEFLDDMRV